MNRESQVCEWIKIKKMRSTKLSCDRNHKQEFYHINKTFQTSRPFILLLFQCITEISISVFSWPSKTENLDWLINFWFFDEALPELTQTLCIIDIIDLRRFM